MRPTHDLKTWPQYFEAVLAGKKAFEIRKNDRQFGVGDGLILSEWNPTTENYTGRSIKTQITYMTDFEQKPGFIVLGLNREMTVKL